MAITNESNIKDTLKICISTFDTQMPPDFLWNIKQTKSSLGYQVFPTWHYKTYIFHLDFEAGKLFLNVQVGNQSRKLEFQKISAEKEDFMCSNHVWKAYRYLLVGHHFDLFDNKDRLLQNAIWFDNQGNTNLLRYKKFRASAGYPNSIHHAIGTHDKTEKEKIEMIQKGALDKEDILYFFQSEDDDFNTYRRLIIEKTKNGFDIFSLQDEKAGLVKWMLMYKKELVYRLQRRKQ